MAKISNTTVYPNIVPTSGDYLLLTDVSDSEKTKTAMVSDFQAYFGTKSLEVEVSSAEILTSNSTPKVLLGCEPGEYIQVISAAMLYTFGTVAYTTGGSSSVSSSAASNEEFLFESINGVGANAAYLPTNNNKFQYFNSAGGNNLLFSSPVSNPTLGDGTIKLSILYRIITF